MEIMMRSNRPALFMVWGKFLNIRDFMLEQSGNIDSLDVLKYYFAGCDIWKLCNF